MSKVERLNILLLVKNQELRQLYHEILVSEGWEIIIADEAAKALLALIAHQINLIIVDAKLSNQETERFLEIVRRKPEWKKLPIILLDYVDRQDIADMKIDDLCIAAHLDTHLITPNQLVKAVTAAVNG